MINKTNPYSHFYLYAKDWYIQSDDIMSDLRVLTHHYSGTPLEYVSNNDVMIVLMDIVYYELMENKSRSTKSVFQQLMNDWYKGKDIIASALSVLSLAKSGDDERLHLEKPSPNILSMTDKNIENSNQKIYGWN